MPLFSFRRRDGLSREPSRAPAFGYAPHHLMSLATGGAFLQLLVPITRHDTSRPRHAPPAA